MSASNKKKLRKEQEAVKLTEKQLAAQKEAKKVNLYTIGFVSVMVVLLVIAVTVGISQTITNSGIREKNTTALTVGSHELSNAELNYFYMDAVNNFYSSYGSYAGMFGLDLTKPLNEQYVDEAAGTTWADDFLTTATENAKAVYAVTDAAKAAGFTLSEDDMAAIDGTISNLDLYALMYGYGTAEDYLRSFYGNGATVEGYRAYMELTTLFSAYRAHYSDSLTYGEADLRAVDAEDYNAYSSYSFNVYYLSASRLLEGGTADENGNVTYSDAEKAASVTAAEEIAKALTAEEIVTAADLDAAIAALEINKDTTAASSPYTNSLSSSILSTYADWVTDSSRKAGDKTYIANTSTSTDADGKETTTTNGYYILMYSGMTENTFALKNVRHILVSFEGGTTDSATGSTVYSDEEKAAAKTEAEGILADWKAGEATEDSFAALANEKSDDGNGTTGGLYENVWPGQMVVNFNDWCFDEGRKTGDTGIVETEYGYHVMYFVGDSDYSYRDYLIENELRSADVEEWYAGLVEAMTVTEGNTRYISKDLVLSAG